MLIVFVTSADIVNGDIESIHNVLWLLILHFHIHSPGEFFIVFFNRVYNPVEFVIVFLQSYS